MGPFKLKKLKLGCNFTYLHLNTQIKMNLNGIKNIIFDLGGVILNIDYQLTENAFKDLGMQNFDEVYSQQKQSGLFDQFEIGKLSAKEFIQQIKVEANLAVDDQKIINAWNAMLLDLPEKRLKLLTQLKDSHTTFLLSNTNEIHFNAFSKIVEKETGQASLSPFFKEVFYSHEIQLRKPEKKAFNHILLKHDLQPSKTLFIDDSPQHIASAKEMGINTYHLQKGEDILELF